MALTGKRKAFAEAKLAGKSNKDAALSAGYSAATASAAGSRLVKDKEVAAFLSKRKPAATASTEPAAAVAEPMDDGPTFDLSKALTHADPKMFLLAAMNDQRTDPKLRVDAAKALMPFMHQKLGEGGKKDEAADKAKKAGQGRFKAAPTPLKLVGGA